MHGFYAPESRLSPSPSHPPYSLPSSPSSHSPPPPPPPPPVYPFLPPISGKAQRLKEAKEEAANEIDTYRRDCEGDFTAQQQKSAGSKDDFSQKMQAETQQRLVQIEADIREHKEVVIDRLLEKIYDINPELHRNLRQ